MEWEGRNEDGMRAVGSVFSTVRLQGPISGVLDIWPASLAVTKQCAGKWDDGPALVSTSTHVQGMFSEPEADLVFPGAGGSGWKAACAHMRAGKLLLLAPVLHF